MTSPPAGRDQVERDNHVLFEVRGDDAKWDAFVSRVRAPGLLPELYPQCGGERFREVPHRTGMGEGHGAVQAQEDPHRSGRSHQEELDFLFDGI